MNYFLDVITALGTVVASISIISAFILYRIQKRDEYLSTVRESLQLLSNGMDELDSLLNFELAFEMASSLVYAKPTHYSIHKIYNICNESVSTDRNEEELKSAIKDSLGVFAVSFQEGIANKYTNLIADIRQASTAFYPDYKGLFRFSMASTTLMSAAFRNYKKLLLDEDLLTNIFYDKLIPSQQPWDSFEHFQKELLDHLISILELARKKRIQKDIDCLIELVDIVYSSHIELTASEWHKLADITKKVVLKPYRTTATISADLREAEKCFRTVLNHESNLRYASLVQTIENANTKEN